MGIEVALIEKEKALLTFEVRSSSARLQALLSSEFLEIGASGEFFGIDNVLVRLPQETTWSATAQDFNHRSLGPELVQLFYRAVVTRNSGSQKAYSRRTSIWRKEGSDWRMVYHQGTAVGPFELEP